MNLFGLDRHSIRSSSFQWTGVIFRILRCLFRSDFAARQPKLYPEISGKAIGGAGSVAFGLQSKF